MGHSGTAGTSAELPARSNTNLPTLTSFRFAAAALVAMYHAWFGSGPFRFGYVGVTFFFILSGFVLTWTWRPGDSARFFYLRRFARVYPVHFLTAMVALAVFMLAPSIIGGDPRAISLNFALLQAWIPNFVLSLNGPSWSLSNEAFFYALFPLIVFLAARYGHSPMVLLVGSGFSLVAAGCLVTLIRPTAAWYLNFFPAFRIGEFLIGIALALLVKREVRLQLPVWAGVAVAAGSYWLLWMVNATTGGFLDSYVWATNVAMIPGFSVAIMSAASRDVEGGNGILHAHVMVKLGQWSFALYMVHGLMLHLAEPTLQTVDGPVRSGLALLVVLMAIVVAAMVYEWYERPIERRIRSWGHQRESILAQS